MVAKFHRVEKAKNMAGLKTDTQIKKALAGCDPTKTEYYAIDGYTGLRIRLRNGRAEFQHRYSHPFTKARKQLTLGIYPALSLEQARQAHRDNLALLAKNIDPLEYREGERLKEATDRKNTLQYFINEWREIQKGKKLSKKSIENYAYWLAPIEKQLGKMKVTDIKSSTVISFIKDIQKTHPAKGVKVKGLLKAILQIAKIHQVIEHNPASDLQGTLKPHKVGHHPALTEPAELGQLLNDIDNMKHGGRYAKELLQLIALTFARIGDVSSMKWSDIDMNAKTWTFEPQKAGKRGDMVASLVVPLAPQAIAILKQLHTITGSETYVFHNSGNNGLLYVNKHIANLALNDPKMNQAGIGKDYCGRGYKDVHSPHGFRATAKTMLMERLGYGELITELQLGHRMLNQYGRAYNRMEGIKERTQMMNDWANYLDDLKAGKVDNMIYLTTDKLKAANG